MARVKGFYKKISASGNSAYSNFYPFGTDGELVDILSGLNLEDELRLGGMRDCIIEENDNGDITYIQQYKNNENNVIFSVKVIIDNDIIINDTNTSSIIIEYYRGPVVNNNNPDLIKTKELTLTKLENDAIITHRFIEEFSEEES